VKKRKFERKKFKNTNDLLFKKTNHRKKENELIVENEQQKIEISKK
jgi:hypothetical protein